MVVAGLTNDGRVGVGVINHAHFGILSALSGVKCCRGAKILISHVMCLATY